MKNLLFIPILFLCGSLYSQIYVKSLDNVPYVPANKVPLANAGADQVITLPLNSASLSGSGYDYDGFIASYLWTKISGPATGSITSSTSANATAINLVQGTYQIQFRVTDNGGAVAYDTVTILVNPIVSVNNPPTANAGPDKVRTLPEDTATLFGHGTDTDGTIVSYLWTKVAGSPFTGNIESPNDSTTRIGNLVWGTYTFQLKVTDNAGGVGTDLVTITVNNSTTPPSTLTSDGRFTFTTYQSTRTSAGVFRLDSSLVRTLWSDSLVPAGAHQGQWNRRDDQGNLLNTYDSQYVVKVVSANNTSYAWDGTIGNNSDNQTGETKMKGYFACMRGLAFSNGYGWSVTGYTEAGPGFWKFDTTQPHKRIIHTVTSAATLTSDFNFVCADASKVYYGGLDPAVPANSYVCAVSATGSNPYVTFSAGVNYTPQNRPTINVISLLNQVGSLITGLTVQQTGQYLFVARANANQLQVLNKTTGSFVRNITIPRPKAIWSQCSTLWVISDSNVVTKHIVNSDGTLTGPLVTLSGLTEPVSITSDGSAVVVGEGGTSQVVKIFDAYNGTLISTIGTVGGYQTSSTVTNSKFYFSDKRAYLDNPELLNFVAYQTDGSLWVNDPGNFRVQRYDASGNYIDRIQSLGSSIYTFVDPNSIDRVFSGYLEFEIDRSQPLTGTTGWSLKRNWRAPITALYNRQVPMYPTTLPNGRTYAFLRNINDYEVIEFITGGTTRLSGNKLTGLNLVLAKDGSVEKYTQGGIGGTSVLSKRSLIGYNGSNDPLWGTSSNVFTTPILTANDPNTFPRYPTLTSNGKFAMFDHKAANLQSGNSIIDARTGAHLGIAYPGASNWMAKTEWGTHIRYQGVYPKPGRFDVGNGVNDFAGGSMGFFGRFIITSYHGEFWKNLQTNKFNLYADNGLAIGQFGITRQEAGGFGVPAYAGMAGNNTIWQCVVDPTTGVVYIYHGDESDHGAIHRYRISGLETVTEQWIVINNPVNYSRSINYTDLMEGLPFDDTLTNNTAGWSRTQFEDNTNQYNTTTTAKTSVQKSDRTTSPDLQIGFVNMTNKTFIVERDLGTNNTSSIWKVTGKLTFPFTIPNGNLANNINSNQYLDYLDPAGKLLVRFEIKRRASGTPFVDTIKANGVALAIGLETAILDTLKLTRDFEVSISSDSTTRVKYGYYPEVVTKPYDRTADFNSPKTMRITHTSVASTQVLGKNIDLMEFRLYLDQGVSRTIESFGAVGDGSTDNYAAMVAAASYASSHPNTTILFGETASKTYYVSQYRTIKNDPIDHITWSNCIGLTLSATAGTKIDMNGTFSRPKNDTAFGAKRSFTSGLCPFYFYYCTDLTVNGFELDGNVNNTTRVDSGDPNNPTVTESNSIGVRFEKCDNVVMTNMYIHHFESDGVMISGDRIAGIWVNSTNFYFDSVYTANVGRNGMSVGGLTGGRFDNCNFSNSGKTGGTYGYNDPAAGVDVEPGPSHFCRNITFYGCEFSRNIGNNYITSYPSTTDHLTLDSCKINSDSLGRPQGLTALGKNIIIKKCTLNMADRQIKVIATDQPGATTLMDNNTITFSDNVMNLNYGSVFDTLIITNNRFIYYKSTMDKAVIDIQTIGTRFENNDIFMSTASVNDRAPSDHARIQNALTSINNFWHSSSVLSCPIVDYTGTTTHSDIFCAAP